MNMQNTDDIVKVRPWGTIVIEDAILCDGKNYYGMDDGKSITCYTHIHDDHICGLENSLGGLNSKVYATKITKELSSALFMNDVEWIKYRTNYFGLDNNKSVYVDNFEITFKKAHHILGSAQLLVKSNNNNILYSSDFILKGTDIVKDVDYLILDATHGKHSENQQFDNVITSKKKIIEKAREILDDKTKQLIIYASRGTLQLVMSWLRGTVDEDIPFLANRKDVNIARVYGIYGHFCGHVEDEDNFNRYYKSKERCIWFRVLGSKRSDENIPSIRVGSASTTSLDNNDQQFIVNLKEHATVSEVCKYVQSINPKHIILDNSVRSNPQNAVYLKELLDEMDFSVSLSPEKRPE